MTLTADDARPAAPPFEGTQVAGAMHVGAVGDRATKWRRHEQAVIPSSTVGFC